MAAKKKVRKKALTKKERDYIDRLGRKVENTYRGIADSYFKRAVDEIVKPGGGSDYSVSESKKMFRTFDSSQKKITADRKRRQRERRQRENKK